jgi:peptide deformylase
MAAGKIAAVPSLTIRQYGDPVLKERTREVEDIDGAVASLAESMIETMYDAPGTGLAANQVGVQRRIFVYDVGDGPHTVINPKIVESDGEWTYDEGCLSVPGLSWEIVRPNAVHLVGLDLDGNEISIEASELEGRVFQHELDHLDGILLVEHLNEDQRKEALKILRSRTLDLPASDPDGLANLFTR